MFENAAGEAEGKWRLREMEPVRDGVHHVHKFASGGIENVCGDGVAGYGG